MSTAIIIIFDVTHAPADVGRINTQQTLQIDADQNDSPLVTVDGRIQHSHRGLRHAATVHGRWLEGTIRTPYITSLERPFWREFFESTAEGEPFDLNHPAFPGWDSDVASLRVYRPLNSASLPRFGLGDEYAASFSWRQTGS